MGKRKAQQSVTAAPDEEEVVGTMEATEQAEAAVMEVTAGESSADEGGSDSSGDEVQDDEPADDSDTDIKDFRKRLKSKRPRIAEALQADSDRDDATDSTIPAGVIKSDGSYKNKQRVLMFCSRGVTSRYRHLLEDLRKLIPHHKKDVKLDVGKGESLAQAVNAIAEMKTCNNTVFLECRKRTDLYMWVGKTPHGPSAKFHVMNVHTMDELKLTGNCMHGSRPLLSFDEKFNSSPHWQMVAALFTDVFSTPRGHPKSKPFIDRVMSFYIADGKVWVRNYQIVDTGDGAAVEKRLEHQGEEVTSLVEIGPRFVLCPIRIFSGSFGGPTLYQNPAYISPNEIRAQKKRQQGHKYEDRTIAKAQTREKKAEAVLPRDPTKDIF